MLFKHLFIILICLNSVFAKPVKIENFRKGIKTHQDWIDRLLETYDPRIVKLLTYRGGIIFDHENCRKIAFNLKNFPHKQNEILYKYHMIWNHETFLNKKKVDWENKFGKNAYSFESKYYLCLGTQDHKVFLKKLAHYQDKVFKLYAKKFATKEKIEGKFIIKLYPDKRHYVQSGYPDRSLAIFKPSEKSLIGYIPDYTKTGKNVMSEKVIKTFFHEGFHQYLGYYVPDIPIWLNEGFAELFACMEIKNNRIIERKMIDKGHVKLLKYYMSKLTPLKIMMFMDHETFMDNAQMHYPQSWALVHFLAFGNKSYRKYYLNLLKYLKNGHTRIEALEKSFVNVNYEKLEKAYKAYIKKL